METTLQAAEARLISVGFEFIDIGCYERSDGLALQLGQVEAGLIIRPLNPANMEPTAPSYLCESPVELEQALLLLGAVGNRDINRDIQP
jgi:hypothetical protein